jgi:serine phosphatase RsbU (regulator of sigma subunit)
MDVHADLTDFGLAPMIRLVSSLRELSSRTTSVEDFAQRVSTFLHEAFLDQTGRAQTALVRMYGTAALSALPPGDQDFVRASSGALPPETTCLALLGTAGALPEWRDRTESAGHRVIPLIDAKQVQRLPMVAALLTQLGIDVEALLASRQDVVLPAQDDRYRVFHVADAVRSPVIPAQDFVREHGIASALGFGGALPSGEIYAVVLFSTVPVPLSTASLFGTVALSTSLAAVDMMELPLFGSKGRGMGLRRAAPKARRDAVRTELTQALLRAQEQVAVAEADRAALALSRARYDAARAAAIASVAMSLGTVRSVAEVIELLVRDGLAVLGASGASLALTDADGRWARVQVASSFGVEVGRTYVDLPLDDALPTTLTARTGETVHVTDRAEGILRFPGLEQVYADTDVEAIASLPLIVDQRLIGAVTFTWPTPTVFAPAALEVMAAFAAQAAQAVDRARLLDLERDQSATLQRSFLSRPGTPSGVEIEVRYQPAAEHAQIGGDWYDAFPLPDGALVLAVGDVIGHDMLAAAVMGQVRNLVRGIALSHTASPAEVLEHLEAALKGLQLDTSATLFLARLDPAAPDDPAGGRALHWCNAGHPPPLLLSGDAAVEVLSAEPDLMIGVEPGVTRTCHRRDLPAGSTLFLYTDGLVERRGEDIQEGVARLSRKVDQYRAFSLAELCDGILAAADVAYEDDAALLALRLPQRDHRV